MIAVLGVLVLDHASSATFIGSSLVGIGIKLKEVRDLVAVLREVCGRKITYLALSPSPSILSYESASISAIPYVP